MRLAILALVLAFATPAFANDGIPPPPDSIPVVTVPSTGLDNPASNPVAAWDDAKAAKKVGWTALVFAVATMLAMGLGTLGRNVKQLAWLHRGRVAVVVGGVAAVGAAGFDAVVSGGSLVALGLSPWTAFLAYWNSQKAA